MLNGWHCEIFRSASMYLLTFKYPCNIEDVVKFSLYTFSKGRTARWPIGKQYNGCG